MRTVLATVVLTGATLSAGAFQVVLSPTSVIGTSGAYSIDFAANNVLDQQVGAVADISRSTYWLNSDNTGTANVYITIDLGAAYRVDELVLFNTHNDVWFDRGTGTFSVLAGNEVSLDGVGSFRLSGATTVLVTGLLDAATSTIPAAQSFLVSAPGTFRYLSFEPVSAAALLPPTSVTAYGLNELRVFATAVPEPSEWAMLGVGLAVVGLASVRRRQGV